MAQNLALAPGLYSGWNWFNHIFYIIKHSQDPCSLATTCRPGHYCSERMTQWQQTTLAISLFFTVYIYDSIYVVPLMHIVHMSISCLTLPIKIDPPSYGIFHVVCIVFFFRTRSFIRYSALLCGSTFSQALYRYCLSEFMVKIFSLRDLNSKWQICTGLSAFICFLVNLTTCILYVIQFSIMVFPLHYFHYAIFRYDTFIMLFP